MTWKTHALVGANAAWIVALYPAAAPNIFLLLAAGALGGLLPDIDAGTAKIHFVGGGTLGFFRGIFQHRGFFHSLPATLIVFVLAYSFLSVYDPFLPWVLALGYVSHCVIDAWNYSGVQFLFPWRVKFHLLPHLLRSPVKGFTDQLLFVVGCAGLVIFLLQQ